jgi:hypothetical protein
LLPRFAGFFVSEANAGLIGTLVTKSKSREEHAMAAATYEEYRQYLSPDGLADETWMKKAMDFILKVTETGEQISPRQVFDFSVSREALAQMK